MITDSYCRTMARYNAWQNSQLKKVFAQMGEPALREDRGAFFGSIMATANHILWGDAMWMSRLAGRPAPSVSAQDNTRMTATLGEWEIARFQMDAAMMEWAQTLRCVDLTGELRYWSGLTQSEIAKPRAQCVVHLFNHQTHHRGQIHAMITAAGFEAPVSDLIFMPEEGSFL